MKALGHPAFATVDLETVRANAAALPENGVPPEVLEVIDVIDDSFSKLQPQKAATPTDGMHEDASVAGPTVLIGKADLFLRVPGAHEWFSFGRSAWIKRLQEQHFLHSAPALLQLKGKASMTHTKYKLQR